MNKKNTNDLDKNAGMRFVASAYDTNKGKQKDTEAQKKFNRTIAEMMKKK